MSRNRGNRGSGSLATSTGEMQQYYQDQIARDDSSLGSRTSLERRPSETGDFTTTGFCIDQKVLKQISDNQAKYMQERIARVEFLFGNLCESFAGYARSAGKFRDKGDAVATDVMNYAEQEELNLTTKNALTEFARNFSLIQDYREAEIKRIEDKVVKPLTHYGQTCKHSKERLKEACAARKKELKHQKQAEKSHDSGVFTRRNNTKAQHDIHKARMNALKAQNEVEKEIESFEKKKLADLKQVVGEFLRIEMVHHAKALEILSNCYQYLEKMDEEQDLDQFLSSLRPITTQSRLKKQHEYTPSLQVPGKSTLRTSTTAQAKNSRQPQTAAQQPVLSDKSRDAKRVTYKDDGNIEDEEDVTDSEDSEELSDEEEEESEEVTDTDDDVTDDILSDPVDKNGRTQSKQTRPVIG